MSKNDSPFGPVVPYGARFIAPPQEGKELPWAKFFTPRNVERLVAVFTLYVTLGKHTPGQLRIIEAIHNAQIPPLTDHAQRQGLLDLAAGTAEVAASFEYGTLPPHVLDNQFPELIACITAHRF